MRNYVIINGTNSLTIPGLAIRELPPISKTLMRNQKEEIDGRDGDIITELGYSAYDKTMTIGLYGSYDINQIIAFFNQKGTIVFSDEADKYYNFTILEKIDYDKLVKFRTASVRIHCQPFKYPVSETPVEIEAEYVTATGEDITLNNTGVAALEIGLKGNTYQETTTGKQLFNVNGTLYDGSTITHYNNGFTLKKSTNRTLAILLPNTLNAGTYTLSTTIVSSTLTDLNKVSFSFRNSGGNVSTVNLDNTGKKAFTTTAQVDRIYVYISTSESDSATITFDNVMLESGSSASNWEEYTGGIPAPNPSYPMPVEVVTGDNTIKVEGKNLFNGNNVTTTNTNNWGVSFENNVLTIEHKNSYSAGYPTLALGTMPAGNYVISGTLGTNIGLYKNGTYDQLLENGEVFSVNGTETITLSFSPSANTTATYTNVQLELGNQATDFTPYQSQEYEINLGKNLFKGLLSQFDNVGGTGSTYVYFKLDSNKTYTLSATAKNDITVESNRYLGLTNQGGSGTGGFNWLIKQGDTFTKGQTVSLNSSASRNYVSMYATTQETLTYLLDNFNIQLEVGTTPTSYSPYFTPIELCKIGTYQDYLYKSGENWYIHREIGKITLNGSESWNYRNDYQTFYISNATSKGTETPVSNYFKGIASGITSNDNVILFNTTTLFVRYLSMSGVISDFETWLTNHNTDVYYVLSTPTEEQITNAELIEQLNAILNAVSYEDQTNISQENDNLPFILDVSALKKGTDMAVVNNKGNIAAKPIIAVKGNGTLGIYLDNTQMFSLNMTSDITIDTENMEAYDPNTLQLRNRQVTGDYSKFALQPGNNTIKVTGDFTSVTISKYKRWL